MTRDTGFFAALLDFSFSSFITTRLLKWVYIAILAVAGLVGLGYIVKSLGSGFTGAIVALVVTPVAYLFLAIMTRIGVELTIVMFLIAENTAQTAEEAAAIAQHTAPGHPARVA